MGARGLIGFDGHGIGALAGCETEARVLREGSRAMLRAPQRPGAWLTRVLAALESLSRPVGSLGGAAGRILSMAPPSPSISTPRPARRGRWV